MNKYDPQTIEPRWQQRWDEAKAYRTPNPGDSDFDPTRTKFYVLDMFPYPSGVGLHVGHPLGYIATDITARFKRMTGHNVLHPMGFDAFGLPAEQFAVEHNVHPRVTTERNIANMVGQLQRLGLGYDWDRKIATTDPEYYKWTQWIFLKLFNSYFDEAAGRAKPIDQLIADLEAGDYYVTPSGDLRWGGIDEDMAGLSGDPVGLIRWHELDAGRQREVIDRQRLAYMDEVEVNWCPYLGTVLANEEVTNEGRSERGNHPVYKRPLRQWMLRITAYADRLLDDLDLVDWPESVKRLQRNWIGRSHGAEVDFAIDGLEAEQLSVFTTRPDTLFGATYMVLAPEHPLVDAVTTSEQREAVSAYRAQAAAKDETDRAEAKQKTGVPTGGFAINPVNEQRIPIWVADYVMMGYGTGAIMAVPAHDERDFEFAAKFDLPIIPVVQRDGGSEAEDPASGSAPESAFIGEGVTINSANDEVSLNGRPTPEAKEKIVAWLEQKDLGRARTQYKLRDWLFSRQRYWGEPIPILHGPDGEIRGVPVDDLPVQHPHMDDFRPASNDTPDAPPMPPLANAPDDWKYVQLEGKTWTREFNTMPQWAGSCWYYLRFCDPRNDQAPASPSVERYWMAGELPDAASQSDGGEPAATPERGGVDLYVGGVEHAVLHLLYARFWHKVLYDLEVVSTPEPFHRLFNQGYIQAYAYTDGRGVYVPAEEVVNQDGRPAAEVQGEKGQQFFYQGEPVTERYGKMGKSLKNAVSPDEICQRFGADTLRLYEMYLGPLEASKPWNTQDIIGVHRFLQRLWRNFIDEQTGELRVTDASAGDEQLGLLHRTLNRVGDDMARLSFNTAIAAMIEMNNELVHWDALPRSIAEPVLKMIAPFAPHLAEELWSRLGHEDLIVHADWPRVDERYLVQATVEIPVQILGKVRSRIEIPPDASEADMKAAALADDRIAQLLEDKTVRKVITVPGKMVNIVAN